MRKQRLRDVIEKDPKLNDALILEVLLDIREILIKQKPKRQYTKRKRAHASGVCEKEVMK